MTELDISAWKEEAIRRQSFYCQHLSEQGEDTLESYTYEKNSIVHLKNKLGFILFGNPDFSDNSKDANDSSKGKENLTVRDGGITCDNLKLNVEITKDVNSIEAKAESFCENKVTDDKFKFLVELLDRPSLDLDDKSVPLIGKDSHYYRQFIKLIFGQDCQDDLINSFEEDIEEINLANSTNTGTGSTSDTPQKPSPPQDDEEGYILYYRDPKQIEQIDQMLKQVESCSAPNFRDKGIFVSFIFVIAKIDNNIAEFPVIRVIQSKNNQNADISHFIDLSGRCYNSWSNFLKENIFPSCSYCYPKNGFYSCDKGGKVLVEFGQSPESEGLRKISQFGDIASNIAGLGCAGVAIASLFCPVAAPILIGTSGVGVASGLWSSGRSIYQLVDRNNHNQPLTGREAAGSWLSVATGIVSVASMGALNYTQYLAKNGQVIGRAASWVVNGIEVTNTGLNGVNIGHQVYNMYEERKFSVQDSVNLTLSLLFFYHSAMKFRTAKQLFIESQKEVINNIESQLSHRQRRAFKNIVRGTTEKNLIEGNARVIKTVMNLEDPVSYFKDISKVVRAAKKTNSKVAFSEDTSGKIKINGKIEVQPDVINSVSSKSKHKIFNSSRKCHQNEKCHKLFKKDMKIVSKKENLMFKKNTHELLKKISMKNKQEIKINADKSSNLKVIKNINGFLNIMKRDNNYETMNSQVKSEAEKSLSELNLFSFVRLLLKSMKEMKAKFNEGKETYDRVIKYYEDNLKGILEDFIKDISEYLNKIFNETNENLRTLKRIFYLKLTNANELTSWNYFETYFRKLWALVPEPDSVVILPQKAGWLFLLANDSIVRSVFIAPLRISADVEKVLVHAFVKDS
ncbi:uncharacterized protein [Halyomorpha halys]|uniref:uncharacterized protein n=1 Tax=Halyomorpha halys TaxID=286706 RepID=UPI0006D4E401|nr:uncharacterized protein LOC106678021 [Halyomorpha halys]XP_014271781.1 uncharacterized protein LOC106678021 [Halyomorpha halys]XP_014271782.1 uncharacterized protein LOC106678021 [Halyomorpha halys]XP_014271783.1 uncharacterized protein LOC106678021 [Halyomorpha halys]XP_014271784.1 uncharacterized protein LOC106678021 [Halyomorpha halys]